MLSQVGFERIPLRTFVTWTQESSRKRKTGDGEQNHCGDRHRAEKSHSNTSEEENKHVELTGEVRKVWSWTQRPHRVKVWKEYAVGNGIQTHASQRDCDLTTAPWTARPSWHRLLEAVTLKAVWAAPADAAGATSCSPSSCHPQTVIPAWIYIHVFTPLAKKMLMKATKPQISADGDHLKHASGQSRLNWTGTEHRSNVS